MITLYDTLSEMNKLEKYQSSSESVLSDILCHVDRLRRGIEVKDKYKSPKLENIIMQLDTLIDKALMLMKNEIGVFGRMNVDHFRPNREHLLLASNVEKHKSEILDNVKRTSYKIDISSLFENSLASYFYEIKKSIIPKEFNMVNSIFMGSDYSEIVDIEREISKVGVDQIHNTVCKSLFCGHNSFDSYKNSLTKKISYKIIAEEDLNQMIGDCRFSTAPTFTRNSVNINCIMKNINAIINIIKRLNVVITGDRISCNNTLSSLYTIIYRYLLLLDYIIIESHHLINGMLKDDYDRYNRQIITMIELLEGVK